VLGKRRFEEFPKYARANRGTERAIRGRTRRSAVPTPPVGLAPLLNERNVIVFADALQHQEGRRAVPTIGDEVWPARANTICLAGGEPDLLFGIAQEESQVSLDHVERILNIRVVMPRYRLIRRDLEFRDSKARPLGMISPALDYIQMACVLNWFHERSSIPLPTTLELLLGACFESRGGLIQRFV